MQTPGAVGAGRNSNSGFSPTTIFRFLPPKMFEMLSRVIFGMRQEAGWTGAADSAYR
jgi:hypothetical protein